MSEARDEAFASVDPSIRHVDFSSVEQPGVIEALDYLRGKGEAVQPVRYEDGVAYAVLGYAAVDRAFKNPVDLPGETFFERFTTPFFGHVVSTASGDDHRFHRAQIGPQLMPGRIREKVEELLYPVAHDLIDRFPVGEPFDFVKAYAEPYPFNVISALLGVPREDWDRLGAYVRRLFYIWDLDDAFTARDTMIAYVRELIASRRAEPGEDLVSNLIAAENRGRRFTDAELLDTIRFLYPAAGENTAHALGLCLHYVLRDPEIERRVRENESDRAAAADETLRIQSPLPVTLRYTDRSVTIEGVDIPAETYVLIAISSANRDPARYAEPERFSLDRGVMDHFSFGRGIRLCLGVHLARAELRVLLDAMLTRLKGLRLAPGFEPQAVGGKLHGYKQLMIQFDERL